MGLLACRFDQCLLDGLADIWCGSAVSLDTFCRNHHSVVWFNPVTTASINISRTLTIQRSYSRLFKEFLNGVCLKVKCIGIRTMSSLCYFSFSSSFKFMFEMIPLSWRISFPCLASTKVPLIFKHIVIPRINLTLYPVQMSSWTVMTKYFSSIR